MATSDFIRRITPVCLMAALALGFSVPMLYAADTKTDAPRAAAKKARAKAAPKKARPKVSPEKAVLGSINTYLKAFNAGDARAVASLWDPEGEYLTPSGAAVKGQEAIQASFEERFASGTKPQIAVDVRSIRFVTPEVAMEEGVARLSEDGGIPSYSAYTAILVKKDGKWLLNAIRETNIRDAATEHFVKLRQLEWLIGDWVDSDEETTVITKCEWTANRTFITRSFVVNVKGRDTMKGTQVIGWDPVAGRIRSWVFDSEGGFGEGTWSNKGNTWTVRAKGILPEGGIATATQVLTYVDEETFTWESKGRKINGEPISDVGPITIVRDLTPEKTQAKLPAKTKKHLFE